MAKVLILGAGKIGALISGLLAESGSYEVHLADVSGEAANAVVNAHRFANLHAHTRRRLRRGGAAMRSLQEPSGRRRDLQPALLLQHRQSPKLRGAPVYIISI